MRSRARGGLAQLFLADTIMAEVAPLSALFEDRGSLSRGSFHRREMLGQPAKNVPVTKHEPTNGLRRKSLASKEINANLGAIRRSWRRIAQGGIVPLR